MTIKEAIINQLKDVNQFTKENQLLYLDQIIQYDRIANKAQAEGEAELEMGNVDRAARLFSIGLKYAKMGNELLKDLGVTPNQKIKRGQSQEDDNFTNELKKMLE